jgi:hypothetical protein
MNTVPKDIFKTHEYKSKDTSTDTSNRKEYFQLKLNSKDETEVK